MSIFDKISRTWNRYGWAAIFICSISFFIFYYFFFARKNVVGTYSKEYPVEHIPSVMKSHVKSKVVNQLPSQLPSGIQDIFNKKKSKRKIVKESKGELECKRCIESITGYPFEKTRPDFMFNPVTNENLELDLFNYDLKIAVEYNGKQHYEFNSFMHKNSKDKFHAQQYRDRIKKDACKKLGIYLKNVFLSFSSGIF